MIARTCSALLALLMSLAPAVAGPPEPASGDHGPVWIDPGWRRTIARYAVTFDEQGLSTTVFDFEIKALDEKGARAISQQTFTYDGYFDDLISIDLATLKADGAVVAVDQRAVRDQPASADNSSPYFDEHRERIIAYPDVAPGDRIRGHLVFAGKRPMFAAAFARDWNQPADQPPETIELTLDGPASRPLHVAMRDVEHREERVGERIVHHVLLRQEVPRPRQIKDDRFDEARRFEASTFAGYADFAAMLNARNAPMALPDETVRQLAATIVGDATDPHTKVERIHNWVARNIRYVGIGLEDGGWTSQPAAAVLASRYGDCKAHATILKALLAAQGIEANLVAVNADAQYTLTEVATPNFDHAIVYVPELDQYLDPTASILAFGALPPDLSGKPALNIDKGTIANIPIATPDRFVMTADTDYTLASDGTRKARSVLSGTGVGAMIGRALAQGLEATDRASVAKGFIERAGLQGGGDYSFSNPRDLSDSFAITATFEVTKPLDLGGPVRFRMLPLTDPRRALAVFDPAATRGGQFPCHAMEYRETASLSIPNGSHFFEKPAPVTHAANFGGRTPLGDASGRIEVSASAVIDGRTIRSSALVRLTFDSALCPAEFGAAIRAGLDKFDEFKFRAIGVTPKQPPEVTDVSADFSAGIEAFQSRNFKLAMTQLRPFAEQGNARAQSYLGSMYEGCRGVERNYGEAIRWYLMSGGQGDAFSQSRLGYLYANGLGAVRDEQRAAQWYAKAAEQGDSYSQAYLGSMFLGGRGLPQDFQQAANWFAKAADQGYAWAQMNLGLLYVSGRGVPLDYTKALYWLRNAADRNDHTAQYNLGWAYESGTGVDKNAQEAIKWYGKAADGGNLDARARLEGLTSADHFWGTLFRHIGLSSWL